jgi:hypothetical protein
MLGFHKQQFLWLIVDNHKNVNTENEQWFVVES